MKYVKSLSQKLSFEHNNATYRAAIDTMQAIDDSEYDVTFVKISGNPEADEYISARVYEHPDYTKLKNFVEQLEARAVSMNIELQALKDNVDRDFNKEDSLEEHEQLFPINKAMNTVYDYYNKELDNMVLNEDVYFAIFYTRPCGERL